MTAECFAILDGEHVVNIILWDTADEYETSEGTTAVPAPEGVTIGWRLVDGEWLAPEESPLETPPSPPEESPEVTAAKEQALQELLSFGITEATARAIVGLPPKE